MPPGGTSHLRRRVLEDVLVLGVYLEFIAYRHATQAIKILIKMSQRGSLRPLLRA